MVRRISKQQAFTLPEVLMASAVLAFAVAAISYAVSTGQVQTHYAMHELRAISLTEALMEEIVARRYEDAEGSAAVGPDAGESERSLFDNSDDYHGYSEAMGQVVDFDGVAYPTPFGKFSRSVTAEYETLNFASLGGSMNGLTVTVTVTDDKGRTWQAMRFIPEPLE